MDKKEISLGHGDYLKVKTSKIVEVHDTLNVIDGGSNILLDVEIRVDFNTVPEKYHEVFMNMIAAKYFGKISYGDNPFSACAPNNEKKWWQILKKTTYQ